MLNFEYFPATSYFSSQNHQEEQTWTPYMHTKDISTLLLTLDLLQPTPSLLWSTTFCNLCNANWSLKHNPPPYLNFTFLTSHSFSPPLTLKTLKHKKVKNIKIIKIINEITVVLEGAGRWTWLALASHWTLLFWVLGGCGRDYGSEQHVLWRSEVLKDFLLFWE